MMNIDQYFGEMMPSSEQREAFAAIIDFLETNTSVFILKGYAGTGKTTLVKTILNYLSSREEEFYLMAPTGRAAKILRDKTGYSASTIHKGIYSLERLDIKNPESDDLAERSIKYYFPIKKNGDKQIDSTSYSRKIILVDEASMISSRNSAQEFFSFGTDILLDDLLTFARPEVGGKLIFIGDPAQLPPVGDNRSCALDEAWFQQKQLPVLSFTLTEVIRQGCKSGILLNSLKIRSLLENSERRELHIETKSGEVESVLSSEAISLYGKHFPSPQVKGGVVICFSNRLARLYNEKIRTELFHLQNNIMKDDILMVVQNNYHLVEELFNGDMVKVIGVTDQIETFVTPVHMLINGKKVRKQVSLSFRDVEIQLENGNILKCKIIDSLLNSGQPNLVPEEMKALYINFCMRNPTLKEGSDAFNDSLTVDPYFNALRVKYGYAITCHKAQGGEWKCGFVDFSGRVGLNDDCLRWCYTAITRFSKQLYGVGLPNVSPLDKLSFSEIAKVSKPVSDALAFGKGEETPFHAVEAPVYKKIKYHAIKMSLAGTPYDIVRVKSNPYMEEYYIGCNELEFRFDAIHDAVGFFKDFTCRNMSEDVIPILQLLNSCVLDDYAVNYTPSNIGLDRLCQKMQASCNELAIPITNIVEYPSSYYVNYCLKTDGVFSYIQFYFNGKGQITRAMVKSDLGETDESLKLLIQKLK